MGAQGGAPCCGLVCGPQPGQGPGADGTNHQPSRVVVNSLQKGGQCSESVPIGAGSVIVRRGRVPAEAASRNEVRLVFPLPAGRICAQGLVPMSLGFPDHPRAVF
eukprot:113195-Amphidinium_carterae.1